MTKISSSSLLYLSSSVLLVLALAASSTTLAQVSAFQLQAKALTNSRQRHHQARDRSGNTLTTNWLVPSSSFENYNANSGNLNHEQQDDFAAAATSTSTTTLIAFFPTNGQQHQENFINTFQSVLMPVLTKETGFQSCHMYQSTDGANVVLLEQWNTLADCSASYSESSMATSVRTSLKFVLEIDDAAVDRHMYNTVASYLGGNHLPLVSQPIIQLDQFITQPETQPQMSQMIWDHLKQKPSDPATVHQSLDGQRVTVVNFVQDANPLQLQQEYQYWQGSGVQSDHRLYSLVSSHETAGPPTPPSAAVPPVFF